jgi:hypothetical protein
MEEQFGQSAVVPEDAIEIMEPTGEKSRLVEALMCREGASAQQLHARRTSMIQNSPWNASAATMPRPDVSSFTCSANTGRHAVLHVMPTTTSKSRKSGETPVSKGV